MHSINLSDPDVEVKPLHTSVLGQGHCFHVATSQGSKYVSCATSEERDKWMYSLRRTARPNEEHCRRSDSSLKLWVVEAKNLPAKKRYYCHVLLDRELYAETSVKTMTDMLFWGEHFEFKSLPVPVAQIVTINLFREADKKKKKDKDMLVGYINLPLEDLENRQMIEKWITCNSGTVGKAGKETKSDLPIIRIKARKQKVEILPLDTYQSFIKYLSTDYQSICTMLESVLVVREKEEFATSLVNILQTQGKVCPFLCDVVMDEIDRLEDEHLTFRGNSIATKAMEAYMKLVGEKYLQDTLGEFIRSLMLGSEDCEVDPTKLATPLVLQCQQENLEMHCDMVWSKIINSFCYFPYEMREVFASLRSQCESRGKSDYSDNLISGCIFLRFLCPAILYPNLFRLTQAYPQEKASRNLTLIAKTIQTVANFTRFGTKEEFMTFMNTFVQREEDNMKTFLHKISSQDPGNEFLKYDGDIDLGKELSVLHCMLLECREKYAQKTSGAEFEQMNNFLNTLSDAFNDPSVGQQNGQQKKANRKSQIYDNMMNVPGMPAAAAAAAAAKQPPKPHKPLQQQKSQPISLPIDIEPSPHPHPRSSDKKHHHPALTGCKSLSSSEATSRPLVVPSSPTEVLRDMLRHCGESMDDLPVLSEHKTTSNSSNNTVIARSNDNSRSNSSNIISGNTTLPLRDRSGSSDHHHNTVVLKSRSRSRSYSGDEEMKKAKEMAAAKARADRPMVADVSVASVSRIEASQERINESWIQMVNAADNLNGDYIDLIPFMDDDVNDLSLDGVDAANTTTGSQASLGGHSSTVGSSGYQSFSHSQSPVESGSGSGQGQGHTMTAESSAELAKSPIIQYPPPQSTVQPLAFANPLFSHQQQKRSHHHHHHQQQQQQRQHQHHQQQQQQYSPLLQHNRPPVVKSILNPHPHHSPSSGYAGATPSPISTPPQPTPRQRTARTVQRRSTDEDDDDNSSSSSSTTSTDDEESIGGSNKDHRHHRHHHHHRKRGYKPPLRTTTTTTATTASNSSSTGATKPTPTTMTLDYQTSIAPLKKLSQLSSSSSDEDGSNGTPLGYRSTTSSTNHPTSSCSSNPVNRRQYSTSVNKPSSSSSSSSSTPSSRTHNFNKPPSSASSSQFQPYSSSTSSSSTSYQTTFPVANNNNNNNNNGSDNNFSATASTNINGCSTFPRKHARNKNLSYQDPTYVNIDHNNSSSTNTSSPPLPPREAISSSSSPAVPPKTSASRTAFLQRQLSQQTYSSASTGGDQFSSSSASSQPRPTYPPRNPNSIGITTDKSGQFQVRHPPTSTIAQRQQQLQHSLSMDGANKYATAPRPAVSRKPQKLIQQFQQQQQQPPPNQNSVETAIDSPGTAVEIGSYQSSPLLPSSQHQKRFTQQNKNINTNANNNNTNHNNVVVVNNSNKTSHQHHHTTMASNNSNGNNSTSSSATDTTNTPRGGGGGGASSWQVARHMERQSSNDTGTGSSSSSTESSPQSLLRSAQQQQQQQQQQLNVNNNINNSSSAASMQDSSSAHSLSSAPHSSHSHQPWGGLTTPPHTSDSSNSSSLSSLHQHQQHVNPLPPHPHNPNHPQPPHRSGSSGSLSGGLAGLPLEIAENQTITSASSVSSLNNNTTAISSPSSSRPGLDNGLRQHHPRQLHHSTSTSSSSSLSHQNNNHIYNNNAPPPPNSPNANSSSAFASRLSSRSEGHINAITQHHLHSSSSSTITSNFSVANPIPHSPSLGSNHSSTNSPPPTPTRSLSYHSPSGSPNLSSSVGGGRGNTRGSSGRSSYPASRSMDLSALITNKKPAAAVEAMKRTSVDSLLSHPDSSLSPSGSLSRDADTTDGGRSSASSLSSSNRRLSPQTAVHMGISSVQRKLQEQENTKKEYETEVHGLRQQLLEAQERLQQAEMRLLDHEVDTHSLMDQWQSRLTQSEEKMRKQQEEKDEKMKDIISRLSSIEDELKKEQEEMAQAVEQKQQVIDVQEQRIRTLDLANQKLLLALAELKGRALATQRQSLNAGGNKELALEMAGLKTSSC